ncbi:MAG: hypothetical protein A3C11_01900 [Candidatus Sungbacteria bacterium RIFCSPHIGHO2_02_FULL_49_12]|uniref:Transcriptional repressor PaaX-like central Cas2-like domain-containing protein n=1 Tax=Candidatus Sungbacteria bacterium RIFCSPHIGHO2_02_FULL_49_12 TaxID=1802271 RepID=A0A1G2KMJ0_9BACT|nr:MAG: hypothetical protein A3C11_01900 [Candidatus Sungbacteria bacterium RIFCSPHIGHO2_02_FULL_49_12]
MRLERGELERLLLGLLAAGAIAVAVATLPGLAVAFRPLIKKKSTAVKRKSFDQALKRFRERRLVEFTTKNGQQVLAITEKGKKRLRQLEFDTLTLEIPKHWDGQWSVILFDIPEDKKTARDALRHKLRQLGCMQFHKSVFVHPALCEDEVDYIAELFWIQSYLTVFRTRSLGRQEYRAYSYFGVVPKL